jgi:hypothetical protein
MSAGSTITADDLARLVERLGDRLRHLAVPRLAPLEADVRAALVRLAALGLAAAGERGRPLPTVAAVAWGDQVTVLGRDLVEGLRRRPDPALLARGYAVLLDLRRALP